MARRSQSTAPPPPIKVQAPALVLTGLEQAYDWVLVETQIGLRLALEWYDENIPIMMFGKQLDSDQNKTLIRAQKAKAQGFGTDLEPERVQAWRTCLRMYEKIWLSKGLLKIDETFDKKDRGEEPGPDVKKIKTVLDNLNAIFGDLGVRFAPSMEKERAFSGGTINLPQSELEAMVTAPPLKTALSEAPTIAKVISLETVEGQPSLNGARFMENLPKILDRIFDWSAGVSSSTLTNPIGKIKSVVSGIQGLGGPGPSGPTVAPGKAPRAPKVPSNNPPVSDPWGVFKANTCKAALAALLFDKKPHDRVELEAICTSYNSTPGPIHHCLKGLEAKGHKVTWSMNRKVVQVK